MTMPPASYLLIGNEVRGPFTPDQLRKLAEVGAITPETDASARAAGPWSKLQDRPDCAEFFPERRQFQFKAREFENVNQAPEPPVDHRELIAAANRRPDAVPGVPPPLPPPAANDVLDIVRETTRAQTRHEKAVDLTPRPNQRLRDYLILMVLVNGFLVADFILTRGSMVTSIFSLSGIVLFSAGITWIMFGVMSRY
jgi:hypothetical protein